jgi:hypothetical protein
VPLSRPGQGEALAAWAAWALATTVVAVTYARVDPALLYHVSGNGLSGGLSRAFVHLNYPVALVGVTLALVALGALPGRAWWAGGPAIALCAVVAWPGVVDQDDLDATWANLLPALGVALALALTVAAARRAGASCARRLPGDPARLALAVAVLVLSLPWVATALGFQLPGDVFAGEELYAERDGALLASVHLGEHHGFHGALLLLTALLVSRVRPPGRRLRGWLLAWTAGLGAYGAVNFVQDLWYEQAVKRGWVEWTIPSALEPRLEPVWLAVLALAVLAVLLLLGERRAATGQPSRVTSPASPARP